MTWWEYVERTASTVRQRDISERTGIDATNVSRWKTGSTPGAQVVAQFARGYDRPVLEAFVAAGYLTEAEAKVRPHAAPDYSGLTDEQLVEMLAERLAERHRPEARLGVTSMAQARTAKQQRVDDDALPVGEASYDHGAEPPADPDFTEPEPDPNEDGEAP